MATPGVRFDGCLERCRRGSEGRRCSQRQLRLLDWYVAFFGGTLAGRVARLIPFGVVRGRRRFVTIGVPGSSTTSVAAGSSPGAFVGSVLAVRPSGRRPGRTCERRFVSSVLFEGSLTGSPSGVPEPEGEPIARRSGPALVVGLPAGRHMVVSCTACRLRAFPHGASRATRSREAPAHVPRARAGSGWGGNARRAAGTERCTAPREGNALKGATPWALRARNKARTVVGGVQGAKRWKTERAGYPGEATSG